MSGYAKNSYYQDNLHQGLHDPKKAMAEKHFLMQGENPENMPLTSQQQSSIPRSRPHSGGSYGSGGDPGHRRDPSYGSQRPPYSGDSSRSSTGRPHQGGAGVYFPQTNTGHSLRRDLFSNPVEEETLLGSSVTPVKLTPCWEERNLPADQLNFKHLTIDDDFMNGKPPKDRCNLVYLILVIHGIGTLMPWNMFITAKQYFTEYKLNPELLDASSKEYQQNFLSYLGLASQFPNLLFNWLNLFVHLGGDMTTRIVISLLIEVIIFIGTVVLAMLDSSSWPEIFFWVTMLSVVILNMANGIYQNSVYGIAAKLPMKYSNAVILGSNISGTLTALINIASILVSPNTRTAAIYYFITALFFLLLCFDTYFALPLTRFYRYYERQASLQQSRTKNGSSRPRIPYWMIFKKTFPQLFNVFMVFFVTLSIFPAVQSNVKIFHEDFFINKTFFTPITCYLSFNLFAMIGNLFPFFCRFPGPQCLWVPVMLRILLIPAFMFCNYMPSSNRVLPILFYDEWTYIALGILLGWSSGYFSSLAMMYAPRCVEQQYAGTAGMMAAASLILGICCGINFSFAISWFVETFTFYA